MKKKLESFQSKKFDNSQMENIFGGETTYGPWKRSSSGPGGVNSDKVRTTYNPEGYPPGVQGTDTKD